MLKASEKRIAAQQRNIDRKRVLKEERASLNKAQALANDLELKQLCVALARLQAKNSGEHEGKTDKEKLKALHARCQEMYGNFRKLPAHKQPEAFNAARRYLASGGDAGEFIKFGGVAHGDSKAKLEEHTEQDREVL
jgi:hypothetical protein